MSKAFTRESDDIPEQPIVSRLSSRLPPGAKNYLTPDGERKLREEVDHLLQNERPKLATSTADREAKQQLQLLDARILALQQSLQSAVIVPSPAPPHDQVRFGATVT